jgi:uncharacterized membrane protein
MREISLNSFCALSALIAAHVFGYVIAMWARVWIGFVIVIAVALWVCALAIVLGYPELPMAKVFHVPNWLRDKLPL